MASRPVFFIFTLGQGGWALDPGGALQINRAVHDLGPAITVVPPFDPKNIGQVPTYIKTKVPAEALLVLSGDSCGANLFGWVAEQIYPRPIEAAELIQASCFCGDYPIPDNVSVVELFYTNWLVWPIPGLGSFKIKPKQWAPTIQSHVRYPGAYLVNNGKTRINYVYAPSITHPGDDQVGTQQAVVNACKRVISKAAAEL